MKRITLIIVILAVASFAAAGRTEWRDQVYRLPSSRRTEVTLRAVLPMYFGASTIYNKASDAPGLSDPGFMFGLEMLGLQFNSKGGPLEANAALGWEFMRGATYFGLPVRLAVKPGGRWKLFAGITPALRVNRSSTVNPYRLSATAGFSYRTVGLWASYGITPMYLDTPGPRTLSFGVVLGI